MCVRVRTRDSIIIKNSYENIYLNKYLNKYIFK